MKILFLSPKFPKTFWGFQYALPFVSKKAANPPLGLLTVASMVPNDWGKKLIDLNVQKLNEKDLLWPDFIFISAMIAQKDSVKEIISQSKKLNKKIIAGGPLFSTGYEEFLNEIDCFVLGEAENIFSYFLEDLKNNNLKKIYQDKAARPDIRKSPVPLWELLDTKKYASMSIQFSRGCPFNCEFCDIVLLNGRVPRTKDKEQVLNELDALYERGWRSNVFFVDDNFIGNKVFVKKEILPAIIKWQEERKNPFTFNTQSSINIADDKELMQLMAQAGFNAVFIGIESPDEESLKGCGKFQNTNRNLIESIKTIQNYGLQVQGGFIVGFDQDTLSTFNQMPIFIQKSGIVNAMVSVLQALPKTRLWERLTKEKRLISQSTTNNMDCTINFLPKMSPGSLVSNYKKILNYIYSPKNYYQRLINFLKEYRPRQRKNYKFNFVYVLAFLKSIWILGIMGKERLYYWKIFFWTLAKHPKFFPTMIEMSIKGFHLRKISEEYL